MANVFSSTSTRKMAEQAIKDDDLGAATRSYERLVHLRPTDEPAYNRLMMLYRKQQLYRKELNIINTAIKKVSKGYHSRGLKTFSNNSAVKRISNSLLKLLGLKNAKGIHVDEPEQVLKWKARKLIVQKKIK